jgi:SAM-dependent methyltransferase
VASGSEHPALEALRARVEEEEAAYAEVLATIDRLCAFPLPAEAAPEIRERLLRLNELWPAPERPAGSGLAGLFRRRAWDAVAPAIERQVAFDAALVQLLNTYLEKAEGLHARLRELAGAVVRYAQRVQPLVDARDRVATALATTRSELLLEAFDRRLEGLLALRDRLEAVAGEVRAIRGGRGDVRRRTAGHAGLFRDLAPVLDLDTVEGDPVDLLRAQERASLGGIAAVRVAEHLAPPALTAMLAEAHRALRPGGLLVHETPDPTSLRVLVAAAGFTDVRVETRTPADRLQPIPADGLPPAAAAALNDNVGRLNALLYGPLEYFLLARR